MCRLKICVHLSLFPRKPNGDYRSSSVHKDRSRSPIERVVVPSALGVHSSHLYSHAHHHHHHLVSLAGMDQPLALTKNSMVESARSSTAAMATVPHTVSAVERQQVCGGARYIPSHCLVVPGVFPTRRGGWTLISQVWLVLVW